METAYIPVGHDGGLVHDTFAATERWCDVRNLERIHKLDCSFNVSINLPDKDNHDFEDHFTLN